MTLVPKDNESPAVRVSVRSVVLEGRGEPGHTWAPMQVSHCDVVLLQPSQRTVSGQHQSSQNELEPLSSLKSPQGAEKEGWRAGESGFNSPIIRAVESYFKSECLFNSGLRPSSALSLALHP